MEVARQVLSVLLVFALLGAALWTLRQRSGVVFRGWPRRTPGRTKALEPIERVSLTPQHALHLVRVGGREFLVATHPRGCTFLTESPPRSSEGAGA
jgi:flagellar biogenesis protein FliO